MRLVGGFSRPVFADAEQPQPAAVRSMTALFRQACPGMRVDARENPGATRHEILGPVAGCWSAHANDPELRHRGASGGVLTALAAWLRTSGDGGSVVGAGRSPDSPRRTIPLTITSRSDALNMAGSRYCPVSVLSSPDIGRSTSTVVGKPCEVSALRRATELSDRFGDPVLLSFFCAGTPSQQATDELIERLGIGADEPLSDLWYRGRGWPGRFTAVSTRGVVVSESYSRSWGAALGPTVQWRCRVCADGVGEAADITAGDFWWSDEDGYPVFEEGLGRSALIARTRRGLEIVQAAIAADIITVEPLDPDLVASVQPYQASRRRLLVGRLVGTRVLMGSVPRYSGFGLFRLAVASPIKVVHELRKTVAKIRYRQRQRIKS